MGFSQVQGLDFSEVFAPTLRLETLQLLLSLLGNKGWVGRQIDFKTAFLNGHLDEPVYMCQPPGFKDPAHPDWVCKVSRAIYSLCQPPRQWNIELNSALVSLGLTRLAYNPSLYFKLLKGVLVGAIKAHIDDLAVVGCPDFFTSFVSDVGKRFSIGFDEDLSLFLSISIRQDIPSRTVSLGQSHYISSVVSTFLPSSSTSAISPTNIHFKSLSKQSPGSPESPPQYNQLIGSLLWISQCTPPNILFAVNMLSQFLKDPSIEHWNAAI